MAKQKMTEDRFKGIRKAIEEGRDRRAIMEYWNIKASTYARVKQVKTFSDYVKLRNGEKVTRSVPEQKKINIVDVGLKGMAKELARSYDKHLANALKGAPFKQGDLVMSLDGKGPYYVCMPTYKVTETKRHGLLGLKKKTGIYEGMIISSQLEAVGSVYYTHKHGIKVRCSDYQLLTRR